MMSDKDSAVKKDMVSIIVNQVRHMCDSSSLSLLLLQELNIRSCTNKLITMDEMHNFTDEVERISFLKNRLERDLAFEALQREFVELLEEGDKDE